MPKNILLAGLACAFLIIIPLSASSQTSQSAWRCGDALIQIGDTKASVLTKCGEPTIKTITTESYRKKTNSKKTNSKSKRPGTDEKTVQTGEEWFYNCGPDAFNSYLTFKGKKLTLIELNEYGSGESYCKGADENPNLKKSKEK